MADKIIVLSGKQFSGKDTVAKILLEKLSGFRRIGLGDAIKIEYSNQTGLTLEEIENNKSVYRPDLIALGDKGRAMDPDFWLKFVVQQEGNIIVPDVRMPREYDVFKQNNAYRIRVESSEKARAQRGQLVKSDDTTEVALDGVSDWSYVIQNESTYEALVDACEELLADIKNYFKI